jgi:hypothetical protein
MSTMENDSIRASGSNTLVDIWIEGKLRAICITREAIDAFLGYDRGAEMTENDRCEFVRMHLPLVVRTATTRLQEIDPRADSVAIGSGDFPNPTGRTGNRRKTERRKADRRKNDRPVKDLPHGERRRGERRKSERRGPPKRPA